MPSLLWRGNKPDGQASILDTHKFFVSDSKKKPHHHLSPQTHDWPIVAIMSYHYHLMLRINLAVAKAWDAVPWIVGCNSTVSASAYSQDGGVTK